jgi:uncharacterized protein YdaU (DUF1376 family)
MKFRYFALYPVDFLANVGHLGNTELGIYWRLLLVYYRDQRPLPSDVDKLRRIAMTFSPEECRALEEVVAEFFVPGTDDEGRRVYRHIRADKEIDRAMTVYNHRAEGAAKARARKDPHGQGDPLITNVDDQGRNQGWYQPEKEKEKEIKKKTSSAGADMPPGFVDFWAAWPASQRKVSKAECLKRWKARNLEALAPQIVTHVALMKASRQWVEGFEPAPLTYLNQRRWEDDVPPLQASGDNQFAGAL